VEGYLLLAALVATALAVYWSAENDTRISGKGMSGLFAYLPGREPRPPGKPGRAPFPPVRDESRPVTGAGA
jgi:hypothetical protein